MMKLYDISQTSGYTQRSIAADSLNFGHRITWGGGRWLDQNAILMDQVMIWSWNKKQLGNFLEVLVKYMDTKQKQKKYFRSNIINAHFLSLDRVIYFCFSL